MLTVLEQKGLIKPPDHDANAQAAIAAIALQQQPGQGQDEGQQVERAAPSRAQLDVDAEWVARRYELGTGREPERVRVHMFPLQPAPHMLCPGWVGSVHG